MSYRRKRNAANGEMPRKYLYTIAYVATGKMRCRDTSGDRCGDFRDTSSAVTSVEKFKPRIRKVHHPRRQRCLPLLTNVCASRPTLALRLPSRSSTYIFQAELFIPATRATRHHDDANSVSSFYLWAFFPTTRAVNAHPALGILCAGRTSTPLIYRMVYFTGSNQLDKHPRLLTHKRYAKLQSRQNITRSCF